MISHPFKFSDIQVLCETFSPDQQTGFDLTLIDSIERYALQNRKLVGICNIAGGVSEFHIAHDNLRETVHAKTSNSFNRQRQLVCGISLALFNTPHATVEEIASVINQNRLKIYITEASSVLFNTLQNLIQPDLLFYSANFGTQHKSGDLVNGVRHEDLQATSFADASFDVVLSTEVFAHIPNVAKAEGEVVRILKPGGVYVFTVPLIPYAEHDAEQTDEQNRVFRVFSYNDLKSRFNALGCKFTTYHLWSRMLGIVDQNAYVSVVIKPPEKAYSFNGDLSLSIQSLQTTSTNPVLQSAAPVGSISVESLAKTHGDDWLARHLADIASYFVGRGQQRQYFDYWQERGFHLTPNHFYEAIPDTRQLQKESFWRRVSELPGIDMNDEHQLHLLRECFPAFANEYNEFPKGRPDKPYLFTFDNPLFSNTDALVLYTLVRHLKPKLVLEVGSGVSTTVTAMAAVKNGNTEVIALEPYPNEILKAGFPGLTSLIQTPIEAVDMSMFQKLQDGDILFIDTTHVVKTGGDVTYLFLEVLPRLNKGVYVHIHDIFFPFDYPKDWVLKEHRFWTEQYLVQAFLLFNSEFEVIFGNSYVAHRYMSDFQKTFPKSPQWGGGSLWIRRKP